MRAKIVALVSILLFAVLPVLNAGEEIVIPTPYEQDVYLFVPDDPEELREFYIDLATLYYEQRYDLDRSVVNVDKLLDQIEELTGTIESHKEYLEEAVILLEETKFFSRSFDIGAGYNFQMLRPTYHINLTYMLTDRFQGGFGLEFPFAVRAFVGIRY